MRDEERPLLQSDRALPTSYHTTHDPDADFDPNDDQDDPRQWPMAYRWGLVSLLALMAFTVYASIPPTSLPLPIMLIPP